MNISVDDSTAKLLQNFTNEQTKTYNHEGHVDRILRFGCDGTLFKSKFPNAVLKAMRFFVKIVAVLPITFDFS